MEQNKEELVDLGLELHVISSSCKPVVGWIVRDGIQECREACAGHGYLKGWFLLFDSRYVKKSCFSCWDWGCEKSA